MENGTLPGGLDRRRALAGLAAATVASCGPRHSGGGGAERQEGPGAGRVAVAADGQTLRLEDGRMIRLAGVLAPRPPDEVGGGEPEGEAALRHLRGLAVGRAVRWDTAVSDRWGRRVALVRTDAGVSLQEACVAAGCARVRPEPAARASVRRLLAAEAAARGAHRGLWAHDAYQPRAAHSADAGVGGFHLVFGRIHAAEAVRGAMLIRFTANRRSGLTLSADAAARAEIGDAFLASLPGAWVRARGVIERRGGPRLTIREAAQIEVLSPASPTGRAA